MAVRERPLQNIHYIIVGELLAFLAHKRLAAPCLLVVFCIKYYG